CGVLGDHLLQERSDTAVARCWFVADGLHHATQTFSVGRLIDGAHRAEDDAGAGLDQVHAAQVPTRVAQVNLAQVPTAGGDLEALTGKAHRAVGAALAAFDLDAERGAQRLAPGALAGDVRACEVALERGGP